MKKNIINSLILSATMTLFVGCGSNSKSDGGSGAAGTTTGLSISYMATEYDQSKGFIDHYRVHAADSNGNAVSGLSLDMSIVNGVKRIRNRKLQLQAGGIETSTPIAFFDNGINFAQTSVIAGDNLIIIPSEGRTGSSYLGDWNIQSVGAQLALSGGSFNLENTNGLTYIIGNEQRFLGSSRGRIAIAHIEEVKNVTSSDGFSYFDVVYDVALGGHTVTLGVHTSGNRLSGAKIAGLRGGTYSGETITLPIDGHSHTAYMSLGVAADNGGGEHLIDVDIIPSSFVVAPDASCRLNRGLSDFHTTGGGYVKLVIDTVAPDSNTTTTTTSGLCTVTWTASNTSIYLEY